MKNRTFTTALFFSIIYFFSCNPDCDSLVGVQLSTQLNPTGHQLMLTATPLSALIGRRIFFNNIEADMQFVEESGVVVTVPDGISGQVELRIEDSDCVDFISFNFEVVDQTFFQNNIEYIFPPTPEIIIPNLPADFPPSIENAWLHPINTDYCFWIKLLPDEMGNCTKFIDPQNSREQSICGNENLLYSLNPLSGRIEPDGSVFITVNRPDSAEDFIGKLISPEDVPEKYRDWETLNCNGGLNSSLWDNGFKKREHMMLLTSQSNGRQLLIYQQGIPGVGTDCL